MSKARQRAKERYWLEPNNIETQEKYAAYIEGYHQAEKDLELTWKDIEYIHTLMAHQEVAPILWKCGNEAFYQEVLRQFKDFKERKEKNE